MKNLYGFFILLLVVIPTGFAFADRLPSQVPETQTFSIDTTISAIGMIKDETDLTWVLTNRGTIASDILGYKQVIADSVFKDSLLTNGGKFREVRNFEYISQNRGKTRYNIEGEKILTYASVKGSHLVGEEESVLSNAGNWTERDNYIRCVFITEPTLIIPAFCNIISAKSNLININSAKISTWNDMRAVGTSSIPAGLRYRIAVTPDESYGTGFAEGTINTVFAGSIMEARYFNDNGNTPGINEPNSTHIQNKTSIENNWKDATRVSGGINKFMKTLSYNSGIRL